MGKVTGSEFRLFFGPTGPRVQVYEDPTLTENNAILIGEKLYGSTEYVSKLYGMGSIEWKTSVFDNLSIAFFDHDQPFLATYKKLVETYPVLANLPVEPFKSSAT